MCMYDAVRTYTKKSRKKEFRSQTHPTIGLLLFFVSPWFVSIPLSYMSERCEDFQVREVNLAAVKLASFHVDITFKNHVHVMGFCTVIIKTLILFRLNHFFYHCNYSDFGQN
jgi:hypothetical protein